MTKVLTHNEIVTLAVFLLGGNNRFVDTEDVAVHAAELAPGKFCWQKYPDRINLEAVRKRLSDAKREEHGKRLSGSPRKGWTLTASGLAWVNKNRHLLNKNISRDSGPSKGGSVDTTRYRRELIRIKSTDAYELWEKGSQQIAVAQAKQVFRIDSYTKGDALNLKVDRTKRLFVEDDRISRFLDEMLDIVIPGTINAKHS